MSHLSKRLYEQTQSIHSQVESNDFLLKLRNHQLDERVYIQYLADLHIIYQRLENGMRENLHLEEIKALYFPALCRVPCIEKDLESFLAKDIKPSKSALVYADHLAKLTARDPILLLAHAYVRYLGDLSGGRMLQKYVNQSYPGSHDHFYQFDELLGPEAVGAKVVEFKNLWKSRLDSLPLSEVEMTGIIEEAKKAFEFTGRMLEDESLSKR